MRLQTSEHQTILKMGLFAFRLTERLNYYGHASQRSLESCFGSAARRSERAGGGCAEGDAGRGPRLSHTAVDPRQPQRTEGLLGCRAFGLLAGPVPPAASNRNHLAGGFRGTGIPFSEGASYGTDAP